MALEKFANYPRDVLDSSIDDTVTSLDVVDASLFSTTGQFRIRIDNELLLVTAVSGTTFTVTRGVEGSTAASHSGGAAVAQIVTAGALEQLKVDAVDDNTTFRRSFLLMG